MVAIVFICVGVLAIGIGFSFLTKSNKEITDSKVTKVETVEIETNLQKTNSVAIQKSEDTNFKKNEIEEGDQQKNKINEFEKLIKVAVADGILTPNEQTVLKEEAKKNGLKYIDFAHLIQELLDANSQSKETNLIDKIKEKGDDFEKYMSLKFDKTYFSLKTWQGDKMTKGVYAKDNLDPDLIFTFKMKDIKTDFAVECKFRSSYYQNGIEWCKERQLEHYKKFAKSKNIPVFIAIGVGGDAKNPDQLFIIPIQSISSAFLTKDFLSKYEKKNKDHNMYFNEHKKTLM